jgi:DNA-binding transcriptional ArsR family regulator
MNENRRQILEMLAAGKINADEAERLLTALESGSATTVGEHAGSVGGTNGSAGATVKTRAKYLRVLVEAPQEMTGLKGPTSVNVRVPMQLLRAGVRLASLIPAQAHQQLDEAFSRHGVPLTLSQIKPENLEELIDHLEDLTVDVATTDDGTTKVRVFCE